MELLAEQGADDIMVFGGGIIPEDDITALKKKGVGEIFLPGDTTDSIIEWINTHITPRGDNR
jgi:methylmalonyl-CoA mutase C-terminal domain/subunit